MFGWTTFGRVKFKDDAYNYDIIVDTDMFVRPRNLSISQNKYGDNHHLGKEELETIVHDKMKVLVIGSGQQGGLHLTDDGANFLKDKKIDFFVKETPEAIKKYNEICLKKKTVALIHVTC